jgi:hypothetical protein
MSTDKLHGGFNVRGGLYGDTTDRLEELTRIQAAARDAAACLIEDGQEHLIGGSAPERLSKTEPQPTGYQPDNTLGI